MSYYPNPNRHVYASSSSHRVSMRPNLSWSTIREESSSDLLTSVVDEKQDRINRLKKLERLKERRYMDYQSLKRRGGSKEYSDRFQRDCEEFNKLKYRQVYHTPSSSTLSFHSKSRSASVSDFTSRRNHLLYGSRYGHTSSHLRGNQDDGHTLSPAGSISSIVTLDDDYMYGSRYSAEDNWASWRPRSRTSSMSMSRDRLGHYGLSSHEMLDDNLFDDASSEYSYSGYMPQRRAFSSCVTPRKYSGMMTPTAQNVDAQATVDRMNQLSERLKLLQTERVNLERRRSVDLGTTHTRSDLSSLDHTDTASASVHGRFSQNSQTTILPKSPTDHSIPAWSERVNLLLSSRHHDVTDSSDTEYSSSHIETSPSYTTSRYHSEILDSAHSNIRNFHSVNSRESQDASYRSPTLSRSFIYQRPESSSQQFHTTHSNIQNITNVSDSHHTINLQQPRYSSSTTEYSTHFLRDGQSSETGANTDNNSQRTTREYGYTSDMSPSPLSPGSNKNFVTHETRTILVRKDLQGSEGTSHDDVSDSGVESSSELGRVSNSVSTDSMSKFVVSASKPSESRGMSKFEMSLGSSRQRPGSPEQSPTESTHHSFQEGTTRDGQDSTSYHTTTTRTTTELNNNQSGQYDTVQSDKAISDVTNVVTRKEKTVEVEHPAAKKTATVNVEMNLSQPSGTSSVSKNQSLDRSQQQSTKTKHVPQTTVSVQKKQVSSDMSYAETKPSATATLKMVTKGREEFVEKPSKLELQNQSGQNSSESVTSNVKTTYYVDSTNARNKGPKPDNSSIFDRTSSETVTESTTTTVIKTVNDYSTETTEKFSGNGVQYNQNNVQKVKSSEPGNYTTSQEYITNNKVSEMAPLVTKTETIEIHSKSSNDKNTKNLTKTLPSSQKETSQIVFKTDSGKLEPADVQKSVQVSGPNVSKENGSSTTVESAISKETDVSDPSVPTPKKKKSKKKKSLKNGLDTQSKTEENTSTVETSVDLAPSSPAIDSKNGQHQVPVSTQHVTQKESDNVSKTTKSQEKTDTITAQKSSGIFQNGTKDKSGGTVSNQSVDLKQQQQPVKDKSLKVGTDTKISEQSITLKKIDMNVVESEVDVRRGIKSQNQAVTTPTKQPETNGKNSAQVKVGTVQLKSPQKTKSSKSEVTISKDGFQSSPTDGTTSVTVVKTQHLMDATRETLENLQSGDQKSWGEVTKEKTQSPISSKLVTTGYQMTSSVDNVSPQEPGRRNKKTVEKNIEHYLGLEPSAEVSSQKTEETVVAEPSPGKSKKKKKNSLKGKGDNQSENFSKESDQFPRQAEDKKVSGSKEQSNLSEKVITTSTTKTTISKTSETPENYNIKSGSAMFPSQGPQQTGFTQGNMADKTAHTIKMTAHKMAPGMSDRPEEYHVKSGSAMFPSQGPQQTEFTQGNMADKTAHTIKMTAHKMAPGMSDMSEEYKKKSVSAEFPGQQTGLGKDGEIITKVTTTTKTMTYDVDTGMPSGPEAYNVKSVSFPGKPGDSSRAEFQEQGDAFSKVTTTTKTFGYKTSESSEEYNVQNMSAEFPGKVKAPQQMDFTQGNMVDKVATVTKSAGFKMAPGMSERPEEYKVQSISAQFPGPQQSELTQGNLADKTAPTVKLSAHKRAPGISDKPEDYKVKSFSAEFPGQPSGVGKNPEIVTKVTTVTETTYDVDSGSSSKDLAPTKKSRKPQDLTIPSISLEEPEDSPEMESEKSSFFGRVASTIKNTFSRVSPVSPLSPASPDKPEITIPAFPDISADSSVDPIVKTTDQTSDTTKPTVKDGSALTSVKPDIETSGKKVTAKQDSERVTLKSIANKPKSVESVKTESFKESVMTESMEQSGIDSKVSTVTKTVTYKMSDQFEENSVQSLSAKIPENVGMPQATEQGDISRKVGTTTVKSTVSQGPKGQTNTNVQSISAEFPGQVKGHRQTEFTQGNVVDKVATTVKTVAYKTSEMPEEYKAESVSVKFPGEVKKEEMVSKVTSVTKITPEKYTTGSVSAGFPTKGPQQTEFTQGNMADRAAPTINMATHKMAPGMSDRPEEYHVKSISAEFPSQAPQHTEFTQGNMADKTAHTIKMTAHKMASGMSDMPEEYKKSVSAEFPGQQTGLGKDSEIITKVTTTTKSTTYDVEMPSGHEAYNVQSVSFPGKPGDSSRAGFQEQGDAFSKGTTTTKTFGYKTSESSEEYNVQNMSAEFPGQVKAPHPGIKDQSTISSKVVTSTETVSAKMEPEISKNKDQYQDPSALSKGTKVIQQGDMFGKVVKTTTDVIYKTDKTISEESEKLKTVSVEFPGMPTKNGAVTKVNEANKTTTNKGKEEMPTESQKPKPQGKGSPASKKGQKKTSEKSEESDSKTDSTETTNQSKDKQKKEKSGFLGKVTTSLRSSFSKKSKEPANSEDFPVLVKESVSGDLKMPTVTPESSKTSYKSVVESSTVSPTIKTMVQGTTEDLTNNKNEINLKTDNVDGNVFTSTKTVGYKTVTEITDTTKTFETSEKYNIGSVSAVTPGQGSQQTEFTQGNMADRAAPTINMATHKMAPGMSDRPEEYHVKSISAEFPTKGPQQTEFTQGNMADRAAPTINMATHKMAPGMSDRPEEYHVKSISAEFPTKGPQQTEFTQGNMADRAAPTIDMATHKMAPGMSDRPEEYHVKSISAEFPTKGPQQTEFTQGNMADRAAPTINMATHKMAPGMSDRPEEYHVKSISAEFPTKGPQQTEFTQGNMADRAAPTINMATHKMAPGMSDRPEEYHVKSISAEFPTKGPQQTEFTQGNMADRAAPTINMATHKMAPGMSDRPEEYHVKSISAEFPSQAPQQTEFTQGNMANKTAHTIKMTAHKMASGMSDMPEDVQNMSAEFPGKVKAPQQMDFTQGNMVDKVATVTKSAGFKMAPGMSERPEEYNVQSVSADFPGPLKSPMATDFTQGNTANKVATTTVSASYKMAPEMTGELKVPSMSAEFPGLGEEPKHDQPGTSDLQTHASQVSYKSILERGIKPLESTLPTSNQSADISMDAKNSHSDITYTLSKDQPDLRTASLETSHLTLEKPVTTVKTITKTVTTDLTDSPVDFSTGISVNTGRTQIQEPVNTLSPDDSRYVVSSTSTELSENLKSSETDSSVSYSTDFSTAIIESAPMVRQKSWSDVVKKGKTGDVDVERSQPNISSSISIDKVDKPGDRSPNLQQTENEGRIMSGGSQAFVTSAPRDTSLPEHADISSGDVVSPLKAKQAPPSGKPLLRKLSGQDFSVADVQRAPKPALKLVAPDCLLLQTKFETDGYKPKLKSPTPTTTTTTTVVRREIISQSPTDTANLEHGSAPVAPKRRSREFRNVSEDHTEGEAASLTLHLKSQGDSSLSAPQSPQPQVPKRRQKKGSKSDRNSSSSVSPDTPESKNFNVSHPEFRTSDQDVFQVSLPSPTSPVDSETRQNLFTEKTISLNKSPHTSTTSYNVGDSQEIKMRTPKVTPQHPDFSIDDSPVERNPPFERSYSADKSRTMPLHRKKLTSNSNDSDSDTEDKKQEPLSPASKQKRWKSVEFLKDTRVKPDVPPKNTGLNRVKSTSIKLLSKLQPKSKKSKSPGPEKNVDDYSPDPHDKTGRGATREYPNLEKYPVRHKSRRRGNKEPSSPKTPNSEKPEAAAAPVAPLRIPLLAEENDEPVKERVYLRSWDPTPLLKELYEIRLMDDNTEDLSHKFIEMEGLMEKLPMNKKKATLLKTWKRRYFRAKNGWLIYFDNRNDEKPSDEVLLMGGHVHAIGNHVIGIDDGRGRYLMVRCPSQKEYEQWLTALESQTTDNTRATYIRPSMNALKHPSKTRKAMRIELTNNGPQVLLVDIKVLKLAETRKAMRIELTNNGPQVLLVDIKVLKLAEKIVMIEFGSMSVRAGILKERATLPQLFFPNVVAISQENGQTKHVIGFDAYKPEVRHSSQLVQPFGPADKVDKLKLDFETLPSVFTAIFQDLKIATAEYHVMLILPMNIIDEDKSILMNILINQFKVCGVCMAPQALLALYSYNAQSGIMVDIGERLEVLPIYEGFVIDGGHTVQSFGAPKIRQSLRSRLALENYPLYSPLEQLLVRLVMEQTCYVSKNFNDDCRQYQHTPEKFRETLYLKKYNLPEETYNAISHSFSRFLSPEGLFNTDLWGMDYPTIQSLVKNAIEACPMDNRRHLCRSIYLSGGVTLLPGFASRLEAELSKHLNETIVIQVHASSQRYHAAYIGACALCSMPEFEKSCITSEEWKSEGTTAFQKWKMTS